MTLRPPHLGSSRILAAGLALAVTGWTGVLVPDGPREMRSARPPAIRDLGTLGGDWSRAESANDRGWVVGASQVPPGRLHAVSAHAFLWRDGRMQDLGTLGGTESEALDVNDAGQVVGVAEADSGRDRRFRRRHGHRELAEISDRAFLWEDGRMRDLGTLGGEDSKAFAINDRGWVVGASDLAPDRLHSVVRHAFLWRAGRMRDLGTLGGDDSVAYDVSDAGWVVGASQTAAGRDRRVRIRAFLWRDGRMRDLGTLGGGRSRAHGVNEAGQVVGISTTSGGHVRAFLWEDGRMRGLGTLGGDDSRAFDVNDRGQIVGTSTTSGGEVHAFLWEDGAMRDLGTLDGHSQAKAVTEDGTAAGTSRIPRGRDGKASLHAVTWSPGGS